MKKIKIIFLILITNSVYGQHPNDMGSRIKRITEQKDSISLLNKQLHILAEKSEWKNEILEERIKQASDTIANQNSLFDGFGIIYTILTIIIALLGIALPILTYQFGIKPSQEALKEFENNIDKKLEQYLINTRNKQIEQAIENIKSQNSELKSNAITYLSLTQHQGFTEQQLYKLFLLLKSSELDQTTKGTIAYTISNNRSDYATDYFSEAIKDPKIGNAKYAATRYFANIGIENHLDLFRHILEQSKDKFTELITTLTHVAMTNKKAVHKLIDDKEYIDKLDDETLKKLKHSLSSFKTNWQLSDEELEKSYFMKKINEINAST